MIVNLFRDLASERWFSMERYADELTRALLAQGCTVRPVLLTRPWPQLRGQANTLANYAWRYLVYRRHARSQPGDIHHILDHSYAHLLHVLEPARTVVTCHDIAPLAFDPPGRGLSHRLWRYSYRAMFKAAQIITISAFTKRELLASRPYPAERLRVVGYGVNDEFRQPVAPALIARLRAQHGLGEQPLIVHVGSCQPRKNVEAVLKALPALRELGARLVQVGGQFSAAQRVLIESLGLDDCVQPVGAASGETLRAWYQAATVFVFPSLYEGFGLPVLEAMASGTPVVGANSPAIAEVAEDAALLVDPNNPAALATALREVLASAALRQTLRDKGQARSRAFTWKQTARATWAVYQSVYDGLAQPAGRQA